MLHPSGRTCFTTKSLLRSLVANESLTENLQRDWAIDQKMRRAIHCAHAPTAEAFIEPIFSFEHSAQQWISRNIGDRGISL